MSGRLIPTRRRAHLNWVSRSPARALQASSRSPGAFSSEPLHRVSLSNLLRPTTATDAPMRLRGFYVGPSWDLSGGKPSPAQAPRPGHSARCSGAQSPQASRQGARCLRSRPHPAAGQHPGRQPLPKPAPQHVPLTPLSCPGGVLTGFSTCCPWRQLCLTSPSAKTPRFALWGGGEARPLGSSRVPSGRSLHRPPVPFSCHSSRVAVSSALRTWGLHGPRVQQMFCFFLPRGRSRGTPQLARPASAC